MINKIKAAYKNDPNRLINAVSMVLIYLGLTFNLLVMYKTGSDVAVMLGAFITALIAAYSVQDLVKIIKGS